MKRILSALLFVLAIAQFVSAQDLNLPRVSQSATVKQTVGLTDITIMYSRPGVKGRVIWGELVPYDQVWRTGANEATLFATDKEIKVEGKKLPAGKYSLYTIPGEKEWVFIFNSQTGQWGVKDNEETTEDPAKDVLRVTVKPEKSASFNERMKFDVDKAGFALLWENLKVPVSVK